MTTSALTRKVRNAGIVGHEGSGKTTLIEHMLHTAGAIKRVGKVEEDNTVGDYLEEEHDHHHTIAMKLMHLDWQNCRVHLVDHPGYTDFIGEVASSAPMLDSMVIVVDGITGPQVGTDNAIKYANENNLPHVFFINKLDKDNCNFESIVETIQKTYGSNCIPLIIPTYEENHLNGVTNLTSEETTELWEQGQAFKSAIIDAVAETDDNLLEKFLDTGNLSLEELSTGLRKGIQTGAIVPIIAGSAEADTGISQLLDIIVNYLPSPSDHHFKAHNGSSEDIEIDPSPEAPFLAQVFHTVADPYVGQLTFFRVLSGTLKSDSEFYNVTSHNKERVGKIFLLNGKEQEAVNEVGPGDLAALTKLKHTHFGDTLAERDNGIELPEIPMPVSFYKLAISPKTRADEDKIGEALHRLQEEDPTFTHYRDEATQEHIIKGLGDLQLEILIERLKNKFNVDAEVRPPKVAYKETIRGKANMQGKYKKQTGGHGQYGDVHIKISPNAHDTGYTFVDSIVGGVVPRQYIPHVDKGAQEALKKGVIAGFPVVDVTVELHDGSYHNVDSSEMAFKVATAMAIRKGVKEAQPYILEPIMELEVVVPEEYMGDINGDLNSRRGKILNMDAAGYGQQRITAHVPESEILQYPADLKSITHGRGAYSLKFDHYDDVPDIQSKEIIAKYEKEKAEG